jgi:hypothetical protein
MERGLVEIEEGSRFCHCLFEWVTHDVGSVAEGWRQLLDLDSILGSPHSASERISRGLLCLVSALFLYVHFRVFIYSLER